MVRFGALFLLCTLLSHVECHTVMKTVKCIEYEKQEVTCHKTCWERVCENSVINCTKMVPETRSREVCYTVCKPVWETAATTTRSASRCGKRASKDICYTVCKPVWETKTRCYTVCKPVWETQDQRDSATRSASRCGKTKTRCYTVCKPVWETKTRCYTVCKPVWETRTKEILLHGLQAGVGRPRPRCYTVCKPVWETKTRCYTVCKPVWETKTRCYTVCKPVWETKTRCYTVCKPVWETRSKDICYTVCKPVWEDQDPLLHGLQASLGNPVRKTLLHRLQAGSLYEDDPGSVAVTGKPRRTRFPARCPQALRPRAWLLDV